MNGKCLSTKLKPLLGCFVRIVEILKFLLVSMTLTERELAVLNNLPRVWDAGKVGEKLSHLR